MTTSTAMPATTYWPPEMATTFCAVALARNTFYGGNGNDTAHYAFYASATTSVIDLVVWNENTGVAAGDTFDSVENVVGSLTNDQIRGDDGVNMLDGSGGNNLIYGRGGDNIIIGGTGNDALVGNAGNDFLLGGSGSPFGGGLISDQFYFGLGDGRDTIGDFQAGTGQGNTLYLSAALGVTDFAEAMSFATQAFEGVIFTFANGDSILLQGVQMSQLVADDFGFY